MNTASNEAATRKLLIARVEDTEKLGIVYAASRIPAEELAAALASRGVRALAYHGGMSPKRRGPIQDDFMADRIDVIAAPSASAWVWANQTCVSCFE